MKLHNIPSLDFPAVEPYRTLREKTRHWREGFFVAEGEKVIRRLIESRLEIVSMLMSTDWLGKMQGELEGGRFQDVDVFVGENNLLESIVGVTLHQKIMAIGRIPREPSPSDIFRTHAGVHVGLEGIANAENMGAIVRHCAAFGAGSIITGPDASSPWLRRTVRVSMGAVFDLPTLRCTDILDSLRLWRAEFGLHVVGTTPRGGQTEIADCLPQRAETCPVCLLFGSEGEGLTGGALELCDALFSIPMSGTADSLNVSTAVAITLYDTQRTSIPGGHCRTN